MSTYGHRPQTSEETSIRQKGTRVPIKNEESQPEIGRANQSSKQFLIRGKGTSVPHNNFLDPRPRLFPNTPLTRQNMPPTQPGSAYEIKYNKNKIDNEMLSRTNNDWLEKERLQEDVLQQKNMINTIKLENSHLRAKLQHIEKEMQKYEQMIEEVNSNQSTANQKAANEGFLQITLKRQVRDLRSENEQLKKELDQKKKDIKFTRISQIQTEKTAFAEECARLRQMLEQYARNNNNQSDLEGRAQQLEMYSSSLNQENQRLNLDNMEMAQAIQTLEEKIYNAQYSSNNLSKITSQLKSDNERLNRTVKDQNAEINRLQNQLYTHTIQLPSSNQYNYSPNKAPQVLNQPYRPANAFTDNNLNNENENNEVRKVLDENKKIRKTIEERNQPGTSNQSTIQAHNNMPGYSNSHPSQGNNMGQNKNPNNPQALQNNAAPNKQAHSQNNVKNNTSNVSVKNHSEVKLDKVEVEYVNYQLQAQCLVAQIPFQQIGEFLIPESFQQKGVITFHEIKKILLEDPFKIKDSHDLDTYCKYLTNVDGNDQHLMFNPELLNPITQVQAQFYDLLKQYQISSDKQRSVYEQKISSEFTNKNSLLKNLMERVANKEQQIKYRDLLEVLLKCSIYLQPNELDYLLERTYSLSNANLRQLKYHKILNEFSVRFATFEQQDSNSNFLQGSNSKSNGPVTINQGSQSNKSSPDKNSSKVTPQIQSKQFNEKQKGSQDLSAAASNDKSNSQRDTQKVPLENQSKKLPDDDDGIYQDQEQNTKIPSQQNSQESYAKVVLQNNQKENEDSQSGADKESSQPDIEEVTEKDQFNQQQTVHVDDDYCTQYEPDDDEIQQRIEDLGIDPENEPPQFIDIAIMSFQVRMPAEWQKLKSSEGAIFYMNEDTEDITQQHPNIKIFKQFLEDQRQQIENGQYEGQQQNNEDQEEYYQNGEEGQEEEDREQEENQDIDNEEYQEEQDQKYNEEFENEVGRKAMMNFHSTNKDKFKNEEQNSKEVQEENYEDEGDFQHEEDKQEKNNKKIENQQETKNTKGEDQADQYVDQEFIAEEKTKEKQKSDSEEAQYLQEKYEQDDQKQPGNNKKQSQHTEHSGFSHHEADQDQVAEDEN